MAAASLVPSIIVLALGAGALGFPDALPFLLDAAGRNPLTDIAICLFAMAVVTAQVLGATLLARFIRKAAPARAGGDANAQPPRRTDRFAQLTLVVSLAVAFLVSACLLVAPGAGARGLLQLVVAGIARTVKSPVVMAALVTGAAVLPCARPLLRVFGNMTKVASFTVAAAAAFLLTAFGGLNIRRGSLVGVAAVAGTVLLALFFAFTRRARRNAAGAGGRAAPAPAADTYLAIVAFALLCCLVFTSLTDAMESWNP